MKQTISEQMEAHIVIVENGSGVLIQPMIEQYTYVFTAKHNLLVNKDDSTSKLKPIEQISITNLEDKKLKILAVILDPDPQKDIAIILVDYHAGCTITKYQHELKLGCDVWLYGYPETRRSAIANKERLSHYVVNIQRNANGNLIFGNKDNADKGQIIGFSGGGLFYLNEQHNTAYLCAIDTSMDGDDDIETHGRLKGVSICQFEQLIKNSTYQNAPLAPLLPLHLSSFEHLIESIFLLEDSYEKNIINVKAHLKHLASEYFVNTEITPLKILEKFSEYLKVYDRDPTELQHQAMWSSFLELLVISFLLDRPDNVNSAYIKTLIEHRRLTFIATEKPWKRLLQPIFFSQYKQLKDDGIIVVSTLKPSRKAEIPKSEVKKIILDISSGVTDYNLINNAKRHINKPYRIIDLAAVHAECIEDKDSEYEMYNLLDCDPLEAKLIQEYSQYLNKQGPEGEV